MQARYAHGEEIDQPLTMTRGGQSYFYHTDHLGSVRLLTDAAGAVANRYDYDAFGNWEATSYETVANPYAFTARERDAESGLMFYRARYYDPKIGRFISEDPIGFEGEDLNLYRYVWNDPTIGIDPTGTFSLIALGIINTKGNDRYAKEIRATKVAALVGAGMILSYISDDVQTVASGGFWECSKAFALTAGAVGGAYTALQGKSFIGGFVGSILSGAVAAFVCSSEYVRNLL